MFGWLKRRRRRRILEHPFPDEWLKFLDRLPFYEYLDESERTRLQQIVQVFAAEKNWMSGRDVTITDEMKVSVSAQAGHLILHRKHDYYYNVETIVIHPESYERPHARDRGPVVGPQAVLGEAWLKGPVVLAWHHVKRGAYFSKDGRNLVYHEFAHKLDMQDGLVDGMPEVDRDQRLR